MIYCYDIEGINLNRLKEKVKENLDVGRIPPIQKMNDCIIWFEDIYNRNLGEKIYIFTEYRKIIDLKKREGNKISCENYKERVRARLQQENSEAINDVKVGE